VHGARTGEVAVRAIVVWTGLALGLAGAAVWRDRGLPNGWFTREGPSPEHPAWEPPSWRLQAADQRHERALRRVVPKRSTLGATGRWPLYWCARATAAPDLEQARARFAADLEKVRARQPGEGLPEALLAVVELDRAGLLGRSDPVRDQLGPGVPVLGESGAAHLRQATRLLEQAVARPRLDPGDAAAIGSALALPRATPLEAWERKGAVTLARHAGGAATRLLRTSAPHAAALARAHADVDEATRLLLAWRRLGLRLGAEAASVSVGADATAIVIAADEGLLAIARDPQALLAARVELELLRAIDREAMFTEVTIDLPAGVESALVVSSVDERAFQRLDQALLRAFLGRLALWGVAGCALAVALGQLGAVLALRAHRGPMARLLPPAPWTLVDDLLAALGSFGAAVAVVLLFMHAGVVRPLDDDDPVRIMVSTLAVLLWPAFAVNVLVRGRLLAKHRRAWRDPARVHLGLALGLAGLLLVVAPFEGLAGVIAGACAGLGGFVIACTGGALGERDPAVEPVLARATSGPLLRVLALGAALTCATDLLLVVPWRHDLVRRHADASVVRLERAPQQRRERLEALRRASPDAPRVREEVR
jgi:hypothetical protein